MKLKGSSRGAYETAAVVRGSKDSPAGQEVHNDHDDRYDEQQGDKAPAYVKGQEAEEPKNNKNSSEDAKHVVLPVFRGRGLSTAEWLNNLGGDGRHCCVRTRFYNALGAVGFQLRPMVFGGRDVAALARRRFQ